MDTLFVPLAQLVGASVDQIKLISCLLIAFPLGSLFIRIPASMPALKHLFNICITFFFLVPVLGLYLGLLQLLASVTGTYLITKYVHNWRMPWIVFVFVFGHLTVNHIIRVLYNLSYETVEVTGPQMVLTMKLTTFAWNVWDARRPSTDLDKWQQANRVAKFPSFLEFLGYAFYFPGVLVGPYLTYSEYAALINETLFKAAEGKTKKGSAVPLGRKRVAYFKLLSGLVYLGLFVVLGGAFNFSVALAPWFPTKSLLYRIAYFQFCGFVERCKYYALWTLTEGASILTGLGFTGFSPSGASLWEGAANVKIRQIEFPSNFKVLLDSWNMKTNVWLRECVYKRVTPQGKKPGFRSSMITFMTSAFWHGIASGYYLAFVFAGFITSAARQARANIRPLVLPPAGRPATLAKHVYDVLGTVICILLLNYVATPFMLLNIRDSLVAWQRLGWIGNWIVGGALVFFYAGGQRMLRGMQGQRAKEGKGAQAEGNGAATPNGTMVLPPTIDMVLAKE